MIWLRLAVFAVLIPGTAVVFLPIQVLRSGWGGRVDLGIFSWLGLFPLIAGAALMLWCWYDFATRGLGTPAPYDAPKRLVVNGPYRVVRNPMYVAGVWIIVGLAILYGAPGLLAYAAAFWLFTAAFVVLYEQPALSRKFGAEYTEYRSRVPAWIPRRSST